MNPHETWQRYFGHPPDEAVRMATGAANHVFRVLDHGQTFVLRLNSAEHRETLRGSTYWLRELSRLNLPLPQLVVDGLDADPPFLVLSYLAGADLGEVYAFLTPRQRQDVARELWKAQEAVGSLRAPGYGYLSSLNDPRRKASWKAVIEAHLQRSRSWIRGGGVFDEAFVDQVEGWSPEFDSALAAVEPQAFFDDATTKNLLVYEGRFAGIVDLDWICFGDRLYNLALIRMALLEKDQPMDYYDSLVELARPSPEQLRLLDFYTLVFCVDFMGGLGMAFNQPKRPVVSASQKAWLENLFQTLARRIVAPSDTL